MSDNSQTYLFTAFQHDSLHCVCNKLSREKLLGLLIVLFCESHEPLLLLQEEMFQSTEKKVMFYRKCIDGERIRVKGETIMKVI